MSELALVPVGDDEIDALFEMFDTYWSELAGYEPFSDIVAAADRRREMIEGAEDQDWLWLVWDGVRAGFVMLQVVDDEPLLGQRTLEFRDIYVAPPWRRLGLARATVEAVLARARQEHSSLVEAAVLRDNRTALQFWQSLGFEVRAYRTARRP